MQAGHSEALILSAPPEPFALVVGQEMRGKPVAAIETAIRHMGLRPEPLPAGIAADARIGTPMFRLHFAAMSVLAGCASEEALDLADPVHPSTSLLAASLPKAWRGEGRCWSFVPEGVDAQQAQPVQMREFFKMMALLIDLFDASHVFWSPARLWSDAPQFRAATSEMLISGMPPVLHLVAFRRRAGEGEDMVRTRGLAMFGGQELEGRIPPGWTVAEMIRRLARLALDIMLNGPLVDRQRIRGMEPDEWVLLTPTSRDGAERATVVVEFSHRG